VLTRGTRYPNRPTYQRKIERAEPVFLLRRQSRGRRAPARERPARGSLAMKEWRESCAVVRCTYRNP
jgi:hypothetical protein